MANGNMKTSTIAFIALLFWVNVSHAYNGYVDQVRVVDNKGSTLYFVSMVNKLLPDGSPDRTSNITYTRCGTPSNVFVLPNSSLTGGINKELLASVLVAKVTKAQVEFQVSSCDSVGREVLKIFEF
ncbi:hypothetical protein MNBD_GAMMA13-283 [hydrothermal vent metagenome]|uniref:Uncharacterized protein n=1 Tax=hydrothermal vent metagenome TaxID=652676 RepID=A0A3B0YSY4_9ZZZZ